MPQVYFLSLNLVWLTFLRTLFLFTSFPGLLQEEAYLARVKELDEVTSERDQKRREHEAMRKQRLDEFMAGFSVITTKLKEMYQVKLSLIFYSQLKACQYS